VPERGIDAFAVGVEKQRGELHRQLELAANGEGTIKFLRGGYGCGKTFMARLACSTRRQKGFATSFVVVSDNDLQVPPLRRRLPQGRDRAGHRLLPARRARRHPRPLDRPRRRGLIAAGEDEDAPDFDEKVRSEARRGPGSPDRAARPPRLRARHPDHLRAQAGRRGRRGRRADLVAVRQRQRRGLAPRRSPASRATSAAATPRLPARRPRDREGRRLQGPGHRHRRGRDHPAHAPDSRHKSLNGIRQIATPRAATRAAVAVHRHARVLRHRRGVAGLAPLHDRIQFLEAGALREPAQPQLELCRSTRRGCARWPVRLRELFPADRRASSRRSATRSSTAWWPGHRGLQGRRGRGAAAVLARVRQTQMDLVEDPTTTTP
jgi:hypothetical protein